MRRILLLLTVATATTLCISAQSKGSGYPTDPVPFTNVKVAQNSFWGQRLQASREFRWHSANVRRPAVMTIL